MKDERKYKSINIIGLSERPFLREEAIPVLMQKYSCTELEAQLIFNRLWRDGKIKEEP